MFALVHDITESGQRAPVVRHVFVGNSPKEAQDYFAAHMKSDRFLRECEERGLFDGRVPCKARQKMVRLLPGQTQALIEGRLGQSQEKEVCPVSFWRFAGPVILGQFAALGARFAMKSIYAKEHPTTSTTAVEVGSTAAFWLVAGIAWIALSRRPVPTGR